MSTQETINSMKSLIGENSINQAKEEMENKRKEELINKFINNLYENLGNEFNHKNNMPLDKFQKEIKKGIENKNFSFLKFIKDENINKDDLKAKLNALNKDELKNIFSVSKEFDVKVLKDENLKNYQNLLQIQAKLNEQKQESQKNKPNEPLIEQKRKIFDMSLLDKPKQKEKTNNIFVSIKNQALDTAKNIGSNALKDFFETIKYILKALSDIIRGVDTPSPQNIAKLDNATNGIKSIQNVAKQENKTSTLKDRIMKNEGFRSEIYLDIKGNQTIGYGFLVSSLTKDELALNNNQVSPMNEQTAQKILDIKLEKLNTQVNKEFPWLKEKPQAVQDVFMDMSYNMGVEKVSNFTEMISHVKNNDFSQASKDLLNSEYANQVKSRAKENAEMLEQENSNSIKIS